MAIYRPPRPRWPLAIGAAATGLVIGLLTGLAIGNEEPSAAEGVSVMRTELAASAGSMEVASIEYEESISGGSVTEQSEYEATLVAINSSRMRFAKMEPLLESFAPDLVTQINDLYDEIATSVRQKVDPEELSPMFEELISLLKGDF
ncbi:MAG TPA: hypothetical protein VNC78_07065 [Actinomycetota bacterium]|nr:hypothetical protein [Actinomycetota bacterium]